MVKCFVCQNGEVVPKDQEFRWYECNECGEDTNKIIDGHFYPLHRRGTLCKLFTPVVNLDVESINIGEVVTFLTIRNTKKQAKIMHVDREGQQLIMQDINSTRIRFVIDDEVIADAYDALFSENKVTFAGWWNRRIQFVSSDV